MNFCGKVLLCFGAFFVGSEAADFSNPLKAREGSDPFVVYVDGLYYLTTTTGTNVQLTRASTLEGLKTGENRVVWTDDNPERNCNFWAPEIHNFDGRWYLYYTAGPCDRNLQQSHVLQGGASPWDNYTFLSTLTPNEFGIDGSVLRFPEQNYFVWSCTTSNVQGLCIATLNSPGSIGPRNQLAIPTQDWEIQGFPVNEGPAALYHEGRTFLSFSASFCGTASYQLGLLTFNGGDPLNQASWTKTGPFLSSANGNFGPGHNGFFESPDGTETWNIYHATANGNGACDPSRYTMAKIVEWGADGQPIFGTPESLGTVMPGPSGE